MIWDSGCHLYIYEQRRKTDLYCERQTMTEYKCRTRILTCSTMKRSSDLNPENKYRKPKPSAFTTYLRKYYLNFTSGYITKIQDISDIYLSICRLESNPDQSCSIVLRYRVVHAKKTKCRGNQMYHSPHLYHSCGTREDAGLDSTDSKWSLESK